MNKWVIMSIGGYIITPPAMGQEDKRPNVIFILTDDQRWDALGYAGNTIIQTPQMDRLAAEGVYFKNAFVTTPISAASRASILTGMYERSHDYTFGKGQLKQSIADQIYSKLLMDAGYHTGFFGKLGVNIQDANRYFNQFDAYDRLDKFKDRRGYFYKTINQDTVHLTRYTGHQAEMFLRNTPNDRPFCLSLSFSAPHAHDPSPDQYHWQEQSNKRYTDVVIPAPVMAEDKWFNALPDEVRAGFNRVRWHWRYDTSEKYQHSMKGYYRMISEIDDEIDNMRQILQEKGIADNTVIIVMGDNGYFTGERQLAGKWLMYEPSIRVPLIIYDPRQNKHIDRDDLVLNIDVPKTILALAGINTPNSYQGENLTPILESRSSTLNRNSFLIEHLWKLPSIPSSEGVRTKEWKYIRYRLINAPEELYNLVVDPMEKNNLATDPTSFSQLELMRKECDRLINKNSID